MAVLLSELVNRLQGLAPARDGVPSESGYVQCVKDAVLQLSHDAPRRVWVTVDVQSGTASYVLPDDFLFMIEWPPLSMPRDGVLNTPQGLVPVPLEGWREQVTVADGVLMLYPTPTYTMQRLLRYAGAHVLSGAVGNETYALNEQGVRVALLYAAYLVLTQQALAQAGQAWRYQIGDEMVDKSRLGDVGMAAAQAALSSYRQAVQGVKSW